MPEIASEFPHFESMELPELHARYADLKSRLTLLDNGQPDPNAAQDDAILGEMCALLATLRRRSAGPPKTKPAKAAKTSKAAIPVVVPELSDL